MQLGRAGRSSLLVGLCLLVCGRAGGIELLDVPVGHWSYEVLERLEVRAGLDRTGLETRPLSRAAVAKLTWRLSEAAREGDWIPTAIEEQQLDMLRSEFSEELAAQGHDIPILERAYHRWQYSNWTLQLFYTARQTVDHEVTDTRWDLPQLDARYIFEPAVAAQIGSYFVAFDQVSYRVRTSDGQFENSTNPREGEAEFVFEESDRFSITRTVNPSLRFGKGPVLVDLGRNRLRWGPGRANAMLLADYTPPFDQLRVRFNYKRLTFTSVTGQLRPGRFPGDPILTERYIAAHRLGLQVHRRLHLAASEVVVYGDRGLDLSYLNPLAALFVSQANNGDFDNALASVDAKLILPNFELYGELMLDDLNLRRGIRHFGNKVGALAGLLWLAPFGASDWDLSAEWSWASQYAYTHQFPVNRYEHFGLTLGSRAGTDADLWSVGLRRRLSRGWSLGAVYELERHGEGSIEIDQEQRSGDEQEFLSGVIEERHRPGLDVRYQGLRNVAFNLGYRYAVVCRPAHSAEREALESHAVRLATRIEF